MEKKIQYLKLWLFVSNLILVFVLFEVLSKKTSNDEITVKRINVVGEDETLRMVISNETRQHSGRIEGQDFPQRDRPAGILFFNNEGNESGGIISQVSSKDGRTSSGMSFTMDRYNNDQVIQILNNETYENGIEQIQRGFLVSEFPRGAKFFNLNNEYEQIKKITDEKVRRDKTMDLLRREGAKKRIYLGKSFDNEAGLTLYDQSGEPRLKIFIDDKGQPKIEYAGNDGQMIDLIKTK